MSDESSATNALTMQSNGLTKGNKHQPNGQAESSKQQKKERKLSAAVAGNAIQSGSLTYRYSTTPIAWKQLKTGDTFTRSADGKVVYIRTSKSMAHPLDKGIDTMSVPGDAQNLEVYRVWITTF